MQSAHRYASLIAMAKSLLKSGTRLSALTFLSRILGLVREMTKATFLGTSALSDAFSVAFVIPNLLRRLFAEGSISVAFIPTFRRHLETESAEATKAFLSATFTLISLLTTFTVALGIAATPLIVPFFGTGTSETVLLTRIMFPYLAIISVSAFFQGILNGVKVFSPSGFTPILFNVIVIGTTWLLSPRMENAGRAMAVGVLLGGAVQAAFQLPYVLKEGFRFSFTSVKKAFTNPGTRKVLALIGPTVIGMAAYQFNDVVSTALAGHAGEGVVSSLQYSLRLQELILGIFAVSIGTVILPDLSGFAARKDWSLFNNLLARAMKIIALITIPVTFFSLVTGRNIITLLFGGAIFDANSVELTLNAFTWHVAGLFFIALNRIISPAFYAQSDTKSPTLAGILSFAVNIVLAVALVSPMKGGGIALALSLASAANTVILFVFLRKNPSVDVVTVVRSTTLYAARMVFLSAAAAAPIWFLLPKVHAFFEGHGKLVGEGMPLIVSFLLFAAVGIGLLALTRDPIAKEGLAMVKNRGQKRTTVD